MDRKLLKNNKEKRKFNSIRVTITRPLDPGIAFLAFETWFLVLMLRRNRQEQIRFTVYFQ
jgi:hypothetical protein